MNGQKGLKPVALIKTGSTIPQIKSVHGDFEDWFAEGLGVSDLLQVDVFRKKPLPASESLSGVVITGSSAMVSARDDWSERTAEWLSDAVQKGLPVLGVCYGHQLLAHALGGVVGLNPNGRQIGTVSARLIKSSATDPLFEHLPETFSVQTSHSEVVLELPPGTERLATSPLDDNFAIRFAENVWGIQFHPEFSAPVMERYIKYRADAIREEGLDPELLSGKITEAKESETILNKFTELLRM